MITSAQNEKCYEFRGLSTDTKPLNSYISNGSLYYELDTNKIYSFDKEHMIWNSIDDIGEDEIPSNITLYTRQEEVGGYLGGTPLPAVDEVPQLIEALYFNDLLSEKDTITKLTEICSGLDFENNGLIIPILHRVGGESLVLGVLDGTQAGGDSLIYLLGIQKPETDLPEMLFVGPYIPALAELGITKGGWQLPASIKEVGCWNINEELASELSKEKTSQLATIVSTAPFKPFMVPSDKSILIDTTGKAVYPKTVISQIFNEDGTQWTPDLGFSNTMSYRGVVNYIRDLPLGALLGDVYTVKYTGDSGEHPSGVEYVWGRETAMQEPTWISLGADLNRPEEQAPDKVNTYLWASDKGLLKWVKFNLEDTQDIYANIPKCPTTEDGNYTLKATVSNGSVTYSWVKDATL